jgi:hypothetical protein
VDRNLPNESLTTLNHGEMNLHRWLIIREFITSLATIEYNVCTKDKCKQRHRITDVHQSVQDILSEISISAHVVNLNKNILEKIFDREDRQRRELINRTKNDLLKIEERMNSLKEKFLDNLINPQEYYGLKEKLDKDLFLNKNILNELVQQSSPFKNYINKTVPMLENLSEYYRNSTGETKKKILGCIFSEKMILEKGRVASFTTPIRGIKHKSWGEKQN